MVLRVTFLTLTLLLSVFAHLIPKDGRVGTLGKRFESAEHKSIGDTVSLRYPGATIQGTNFGYPVPNNVLSFGDIVALAGDFYGNWDVFGCIEQISDSYDSDPKKSIAIFNKIAASLQNDKSRYLNCVMTNMAAEQKIVELGIAAGEDPAQIYGKIGDSCDSKYFSCGQQYGHIALCNWDHFGPDAIKAYKAGHTAALSQAAAASATRNTTLLTQAYFLEAFAQHYLTDLFAAGHTREPRRILHWTWFDDNETLPLLPELYPADRCAQKQHDEENVNGLWVTNLAGSSWALYGDKELFSGKVRVNFDQAVIACQVGLSEIFSVFNAGAIPSPDQYAALLVIPILDGLNEGDINFPPMFKYDISDPAHLYLRTHLDDRRKNVYTQYEKAPTWPKWRTIYDLVTKSGENQNLRPYTKQFESPQKIIQIRQGHDFNNLIITTYGGSPALSGPWNMLSQSIVKLPKTDTPTTWISAKNINYGGSYYSDNYVLVGRSSDNTQARHVGLSIKSNSPAQVLWVKSEKDGNELWTEGETTFGAFSSGSDTFSMIKYFTGGPEGASKLELWAFLKGLQSPPTLMSPAWSTGKINIMPSIDNQVQNSRNDFIATGYDPSTQQTTWYFWSWANEYTKQANLTVSDSPGSAFPPQALLTNDALINLDIHSQSLVRLFYGPTFTSTKKIQIDILEIHPGNGKPPNLRIDTISQTFDIPWNIALPTSQYLTWNLTDVNQDGYPDLVGYISDTTNTLFQTIVFPAIATDGYITSFSAALVSDLILPPSITDFFAGAFMTPIFTTGVDYRYPDTITDISSAGIISFFDNYGLLGVRMAAPSTSSGGFEYEVKGQTPGIAGQVSTGLGWSPVDVMGTGGPKEMVGFLPVKSPH